MLVYPVPARYSSEVAAKVRELVMRIRLDEQAGDIIDPEQVDGDRIGTIMIMVADLATADAQMSIAQVSRGVVDELLAADRLPAPVPFRLGIPV